MTDDRLGVVFVHGFRSTAAMWDPFLKLLADDPELAFVTPLPFGYATSLVSPNPLRRIPTFDTVADSLKEFLETEAESFRRLMLVGHSQGGLVVQRYLARMLGAGRGRELAQIRRIVLFACPNSGSGIGLNLRRRWLPFNPQERQLRPLNEQVADVQRTVLNQIVHARETAAHACPIPIAVYAGETDNVVTPASARSAFPDAAALPGDHFTIVRPDSPRHRSYTALKRQLLAAGDSGPPVETVVTVGADRLEVHTAIALGGTAADAASVVLTPYLSRGHDTALRGALEPALSGGPSVLAVLTGESSTGKTRALYEALLDLAPDRPLLRPAGAEDLLTLLEGGRVAPGVVVWLNEAQRFLHGSVGERAAARLREVLERQPGVVAVGTLWTAPYWNDLTAQGVPGDPHGQARALLTGPCARRIPVVAELSEAELGRWEEHARHQRDRRLIQAWKAGAGDGKVVQHLSGGPELLAAYLAGPGAHFTRVEHALLTAALDARRLGHHGSLSAALLVEAADGALHPRHHSPDHAWAEPVLQALATGERSDGTRADIRRTLTALTALRLRAGAPAVYEPADYLDQHTRTPRADQLGAPSLWQALLDHTTDPDDLDRLANAAWNRGLYKQAIRLGRRAVLAGHFNTQHHLLHWLSGPLDPHHHAPSWIPAHAHLADASASASLLDMLRSAGEDEAVATLLARNPAAQADPTNAFAVADLLVVLQETGEGEAVATLLARNPAAQVDLTDAHTTAYLLSQLRKTGSDQAVATLLARGPAAQADLTNTLNAVWLLRELREVGDEQAAAILAQRVGACAELNGLFGALSWHNVDKEAAGWVYRAAAVHADLRDRHAVVSLLSELRETGDDEAVTVLLARIRAAHTDPYRLQEAGGDRAVATLLDRLPASTSHPSPATSPELCVNLLEALLEAGGERAVDELIQRIPAGIHPGWFPGPLDVLRMLQQDGVENTTNALARRAATVIDVSRPLPVAVLLKALHKVDAKDAVAVLLARAPADHMDPTDAVGATQLLQGLRENGAHQATKILAHRAATHAHLTDPMAVAALLQELLIAGADQAIAALLDRAPATHADPADPLGVADLLRALRQADADQAADILAHRAAPHTGLTHPYSVAQLLGELRLVGADQAVTVLLDRNPATHTYLTDRESVAQLLGELRLVGADQAADTLTHRAANAGFVVPDCLHPYGREVDGRPATPWTWDDLPFSC